MSLGLKCQLGCSSCKFICNLLNAAINKSKASGRNGRMNFIVRPHADGPGWDQDGTICTYLCICACVCMLSMAWRESLSQLVALKADSFCNGNGIVARICGLQARTATPPPSPSSRPLSQYHRSACMRPERIQLEVEKATHT